jgi:hypothetical protein
MRNVFLVLVKRACMGHELCFSDSVKESMLSQKSMSTI